MTTPHAPIGVRRTSRLSGAAFLAVAQAVLLGLGYVTHILIGKLGGPPLYGVYGVVLSIQTILNMFLTLGIPVAAAKEVAEDEANSATILRTATLVQLGMALALSTLTFAFARPVALLFGDPSLTSIIQFTAIIYPFTGLYALLTNTFNGLHAFAIQAGLIIFYAIVKLTASVGLLTSYGVRGALAGFAIGGAAAAVVGYGAARRSIRGRHTRPLPVRRLLKFAGAFVGTCVCLQILMSLDLFLVKRLLQDNTLAGYYNAASTLSRIPYFILQALGFVFLPSVAKLMRENVEEARRFIRMVFRYLFLLLLPVTAIAAATSKGLLHLFYNPQYEPAAQPLTLLMVALGMLSAFYLLATIAAGAGKPRVPFLLSLGLLPVSVVLGFLLIPRWSLEGAAMTTIISATLGTIGISLYMFSRFQLTFPFLTFVRGTLATGIAVLPTYWVVPPPLWLPLEYAMLVALYALALIALGEIHRGDLAHLRALLPKGRTNGASASPEL